MTIEHSDITDPNIHEPKGIASANAEEVYVADGLGGGTWKAQAASPNNVVLVQSVEDFPAAVSNAITLEDSTTYLIAGNIDIGTDRIVMGANSKLQGNNRFSDGITYTGTGNMISATASHLIEELSLTCASGTALALSGSGSETCVYTNSFIVTCDNVGTITGWRTTVFRSFSVVAATNATNGRLLFSGACTAFNMDNSLWSGFTAGSMIDLGTATFDRIQLPGGNRFVTSSGVTALSGAASSANLNSTGRGLVQSNIFNGVGTALGTITSLDLKWEFSGNSGIEDTLSDAQGYMHTSTTTTIGVGDGDSGNPKLVNGSTNWVEAAAKRFTTTTGGRFTYDGLTDSQFLVSCNISGTTTSGTDTFNHYLAKNGTIITASLTQREYTSTAVGSPAPCTAIVTMSNGDYLELYLENTTGTQDWSSESLNFVISEVR